MEKAKVFWRWFAISFLSLAAMAFFEKSILGSILTIISILFIIPFVRKIIYSKTKLKVPTAIRIIIVIILFYSASGIVTAKEESINQSYFAKNKESVIKSIERAIKREDIETANKKINMYSFIGDKDIKSLHEVVKDLEKQKKIKELIKKLDSTPNDNPGEIKDIYYELSILNPENGNFKNKYEYYLKEQKKYDLIASGFSPWNGSHIQLTEYIKRNLKDPDSYKHDNTRYWDNGKYLTIITKYRAKNSFGAMVPEYARANAKYSGEIIKVF